MTGGSGGIGREIVKRFVREGLHVVNIDVSRFAGRAVSTTSLKGRATGRAETIIADLSSPDEVARAFEQVDGVFGKRAPDALVCAAAISPQGHLLDASATEMDRVMAVNVRGTLLACQQAARRMRVNGHGRIVVVTSIASVQAWANEPLYCVSKAAQMSIVQTLAVELAPLNIFVNAVGPGIIDTDGHGMSGDRGKSDIARHYRERIPLDRLGSPREVAEVVWFLSHATYMTGQAVYLDGGFLAAGLGYFGPARDALAKSTRKRRVKV